MEKSSSESYLLINETFIVDHDVDEQWVEWVELNLIVTLSESSLTRNIILSKIRHDHNPDGNSYALQYMIEKRNLEILNKNENLTRIYNQMFDIFYHKIASFRTEMEVMGIDE